jgi:glutathione reductase (NADPH)
MTVPHYNLLVVGSGSGGMATARRAAYHSKLVGGSLKIGVIEKDIEKMVGGTCVNVGCVPKKVMWSAATIADTMNHLSNHYGFTVQSQFDFSKLVHNREVYIERLRGIYKNNLRDSGIDLIPGFASIDDIKARRLNVFNDGTGMSQVTADHVVVACGSKPMAPDTLSGIDHCIDSDGFFALKSLPKSAIVIGAGYIAVELAGVLNSLGTKTTLCVRRDKPLRSFDEMLSDELVVQMKQSGVDIQTSFIPKSVTIGNGNARIVLSADGRSIEAEQVILAIGRSSKQFLDKMNIPQDMRSSDSHHIDVDEFQNTKYPGVYALGDVVGKAELTPVAIAAGRRLSDRLFGGIKDAKIFYEEVPTVVFSHPPIGTIGLTEVEAREKYDKVRVYTSGFVNSLYGILPITGPPKPKTRMKLICEGSDERIVGLHVIGDGADEMLQGFGVAIRMGAKKSDLDNCIAIHPTAAEEFVTMAPWGLK